MIIYNVKEWIFLGWAIYLIIKFYEDNENLKSSSKEKLSCVFIQFSFINQAMKLLVIYIYFGCSFLKNYAVKGN